MRRSQSAPSLLSVQAAQPAPPVVRRGFASTGALSGLASRSTTKDEALPPTALAGQQNARSLKRMQRPRGDAAATRAFLGAAEAAVAQTAPVEMIQSLEQRAGSWIVREVEEAEEWVVEGASHGLADTTCFELYGFPNQAPALSDSPNSKAQESQRQARLASCLATPGMTGQERSTGELFNSAVRRLAVASDINTQLRYAEELRLRETESRLEDELGSPSCATLDATAVRARRRQRGRDVDELEVEDMLADVACTAPAAASAVSPEARSHLASILGSYADDSNTLTIDEADLETGALAPLAATLELLPAPHPSSDADGDLPSFADGPPLLTDAALTAALITEQLGDANMLPTTGVRSFAPAPGAVDTLPEPMFALWSRRPPLASAGAADAASAAVLGGAGVVSLGGGLSDISEGEEESPSLSGPTLDPRGRRELPLRGGADNDMDASNTAFASPRRDAAAEPPQRCGSPGSNNAVPWRPSASRAVAVSPRRNRAA